MDELIKMLEPSAAALKQAHKIPEVLSRFLGTREPSLQVDQTASKLISSFTDINGDSIENLISKIQEMKKLDQQFTEDLLNKANLGDESKP